MINESDTSSYFSLSEINTLVKTTIREQFPALYWLKAEISEMKVNASGHCYLEFIEKDPYSGRLLAKAQGKIWVNNFRLLRPYFEKETGQAFTSGLKVLVQVSVDFHEVYGYSFTVSDIDPAFTVGEMMQHRQAVLKQLEEDGVLTLNKELELAKLPTRIAVISSKTASGYEDFENQIRLNGNRFNFTIKLFPAVMQGAQTEESIIHALNRIYEQQHRYDAVVIIRGGGATSDLSCFDSYMLATNCAQFPLPVITGIGHEKDNSVVDIVAHTRVKTPTAAANFLIDKITEAENELLYLENAIYQHLSHSFLIEKNKLSLLSSNLSLAVNQLSSRHTSFLERMEQQLFSSTRNLLTKQHHTLSLYENTVTLASPENILKKGYTLTLHNGKIIKSPGNLKKGELITTRFFDGNVTSEVK